MLAARARSTASDLLRLLAAWLAVIVLAQGLAAAQALGLGPLHRHRTDAATHERLHAAGERHHHAALDASVQIDVATEAAADAVVLQLIAAVALMALGPALAWAGGSRRHVWRAAVPWAWSTTFPAGLRKPPRRG
jgi:hypothetical protein